MIKVIRLVMFCALVAISLDVCAQDVSREEFEIYRDSIRSVLATQNSRIQMGAETLQVSKAYSEAADKLVDRQLVYWAFLIALTGLGAGYVLGVQIKNKKDALNAKYENYTRIVDRLLKSEEHTLELKEKTMIYFLNTGGSDDMKIASDVVGKAFKFHQMLNGGLQLSIESMKADNYKYKVLVIGEGEFPAGDYDATSVDWSKWKGLASQLNRIGVAVVQYKCRKKIGPLNLERLAYANEPYSLYSNINNMLKYIQTMS